jgi:uncharacterized protein (DUF1778 family)
MANKNRNTSTTTMGRPPKPPAEQRKQFPIRLTDAEKRRLQRAADEAGLELGTWMRVIALQAARGVS